MIKTSSSRIFFVALAVVLAAVSITAFAGLPGDILKAGGIAFIVDKFGSQINDFINKLTANKNVGTTEATAVVPIISLGSGAHIGAAQVIGAKENVEKCKAVVQIEANTVIGRNLRVRALVPVGSKTTSNIKRIYGVGVSAIIDLKI
ncbi:MAG: hypothetical protein QHI38_03525 [Armatimonadota bacterium]|nr:hypothetical protein [Armatimonadota bacterium]